MNLPHRVTSVTGPDGEVTRHFYDDQVPLHKEEDPKGKVVEYTYDPATCNLIGIKDKNNQTTIYTYDTNGNIQTKTDPRKVVTYIEYDGMNNPKIKVQDYGLES